MILAKPTFEEAAPTKFEGHAITVDDGYRPNCEWEAPCGHQHEIFYYNATNEDGWKCTVCDTKYGFNPILDRVMLYSKVMGILMDMTQSELVHVSNSGHGDGLVYHAMTLCVEHQAFDQQSIIEYLLSGFGGGHAAYWKQKAEEWTLEL